MKAQFAIRVPPESAAHLGPLRRWSAFEACAEDDSIWLRTASLTEQQWEYCRRLPGADRYEVLPDRQLLPAGALVPRGFLPDGPWESLAAMLKVELPPAEPALADPPRMGLRLVRSSEPRAASWLLTRLGEWSAYVETAPQARLERWTFAVHAVGAVDSAGSVVVRGAPLPPLRGTQYVEQAGIGVPAGWSWSPAVDAAVVRAVLRLEAGDGALWLSDGAWQKIDASDWVRATRSAVRLTVEEQRRGA